MQEEDRNQAAPAVSGTNALAQRSPADRPAAQRYFHVANRSNSFWSWGGAARGIVWIDGSPLASREELSLVLDRLEPAGLPPFGTIVLLFAAWRGKKLTLTWREPTEDERYNLRVPYLATNCGVNRPGHDRVRMFAEPEAISETLARLNSLSSAVGDQLPTAADISHLAVILLKDIAEPSSPLGLAAILKAGELTDRELNDSPWHDKYSSLITDLACLSKVINHLSPERLRSRLIELRN